MPRFVRRWDIRDSKGELYHLTSHQFRATFVRELVKQKVPIAMIMKQYAHVSVEMTSHYLTLRAEEIKEVYSDMILNPESKIAGLRAKEIKGKLDNLFHGKTRDLSQTSEGGAEPRKTKVQRLEDTVADLKARVRQLETDKKNLIAQLVDYEETKAENKRLRRQLLKGVSNEE